MQPVNIVVDARATQEGFKHHKHRGIGYYACHLIGHLSAADTPCHFSYLVERSLPVDAEVLKSDADLLLHTASRSLVKASAFLETQLRLPSTLRGSQCDLVHYLAHSDAAIRTAQPYVVTVHDIVQMTAKYLYTPWKRLKHRVFDAFSERILYKARMIITISQYSKQDIVSNFGIPEQKIRVIYEAADEKYFRKHTSEQIEHVRSKYGLPEGFLLYVGGIDPRKNISNMLKAYAALLHEDSFRMPLILVGDIAKEKEYPSVMQTIKDLRLEGRVKMLGYTPDAELPLIYAASQMLLFPSLYEGFGLPVLQAMAAGTPVVTTRHSSIPEVAGTAALYIEPADPSSIAHGVRSLLNDSNLRNEYIIRGREQARKFSWEEAAGETVRVYLEALHGGTNSAQT